MPEQTQENTFEQAILEAAEKLFLEKGFAMTSTTEIAREAGCNQALVHYYFRTKAKLFDSVFEKKAVCFFPPFCKSMNQAFHLKKDLSVKSRPTSIC
jgi:TetR/AcrR family transcriptional regulator